ncbi:MAG: response regulator [Bdellovibrionota bacterium]
MTILEKKHILVVEDDIELLGALLKTIIAAGYAATGASNVREATFKLKNQKFTSVVLDLKLGEEDGFEVVEYIRSRKGLNKETPIIVASGNLNAEVAKKLAGKIQGALVKPYEAVVLMDLVKKSLS